MINLCQTGVLQLFHHLQSHLTNLAKTTTRTFSASQLQALSAVVDILPADKLQQGVVQNVCDFCLEVLENSKVRTGEDTKTLHSIKSDLAY